MPAWTSPKGVAVQPEPEGEPVGGGVPVSGGVSTGSVHRLPAASSMQRGVSAPQPESSRSPAASSRQETQRLKTGSQTGWASEQSVALTQVSGSAVPPSRLTGSESSEVLSSTVAVSRIEVTDSAIGIVTSRAASL